MEVRKNRRKWGISTVLECHFHRLNKRAEAKKATEHAVLGVVAERLLTRDPKLISNQLIFDSYYIVSMKESG